LTRSSHTFTLHQQYRLQGHVTTHTPRAVTEANTFTVSEETVTGSRASVTTQEKYGKPPAGRRGAGRTHYYRRRWGAESSLPQMSIPAAPPPASPN
ncbi:hypothetical protein Hamer_G029596, partial [Homarus americanus]